MNHELVSEKLFVKPGYVCLPAEPTRLFAVVSSGVAVSLFDQRRKCGGMGHYLEPLRRDGLSTTRFAGPAIVTLIRLLLDSGSRSSDLEANLFGGASNPESPDYQPELHLRNIEVGKELLTKFNIHLAGCDAGGNRGRKIVFDTGSGEVAMVRVTAVRTTDWYP